MRILIDECLPSELVDELAGPEVRTVQQAGWAGLKNGELLQKVSGSFEIFLTIDKRIESEQKVPEDVALITVRAHSNRIQGLRPLLPELLRAVNETRPGKSARVGAYNKPMNPAVAIASAAVPSLAKDARSARVIGRPLARHP